MLKKLRRQRKCTVQLPLCRGNLVVEEGEWGGREAEVAVMVPENLSRWRTRLAVFAFLLMNFQSRGDDAG